METSEVGTYLVGGSSQSLDFTEQGDKCVADGCAVLTTWNKFDAAFTQRYIITEASKVLAFLPVPDSTAFFTLLSRVETAGRTKHHSFVLTLSKSVSQVSTEAYYLRERYDAEHFSDFSKWAIVQDGLLHLVVTHAQFAAVTDYFFTYDKATGVITNAYSQTVDSTDDTATIKVEQPNIRYMQAEGYDSNHIIQLATMQIPKGEKELGEPVTLGRPQIYQVIISRTLSQSGTPLTIQDTYYATKQGEGYDFNFYSHMAMSYVENSQGVSLSLPLPSTLARGTYFISKISSI